MGCRGIRARQAVVRRPAAKEQGSSLVGALGLGMQDVVLGCVFGSRFTANDLLALQMPAWGHGCPTSGTRDTLHIRGP